MRASGRIYVSMSDAKSGSPPSDTRTLYLSDEALKQGVDLLFFAARDVSAQGMTLLAEAGLGRAHARTLYFISRRPGLSVAELLDLLKVTKQSLNRVMGDLLENGFVERKPGLEDRRTRRLFLTPKGAALAEGIWRLRRPLLAGAFKSAGQEAVEGFRKVMLGLIGEEERGKIRP
jgi:DNA-binding MarR family transcriptional regulator